MKDDKRGSRSREARSTEDAYQPANEETMREGMTRRDMLTTGAAGLTALAIAGLGGSEASGQTGSPAQAEAGRADPRGRFASRVVLITGATSGIGEGTAYAFAREGARVFFCGRREDLGKQVERRIKDSGGEATYMRADVRREEDVRNFVDACVKRYGRLDIAFNNAGIATQKSLPMAEQAGTDYADVMTTNAFGVFYSMKHELPYLLKNEPWGAFGTRGVVINNASVSGHRGFANISPYSASKHAIIGLTRCAELEYGDKGIRVNSISPGGVDTPMRRRAYEAQGYTGPQPAPMPNITRRVNTVEEMADVVMFLASDAASSLMGMDVDATGGNLTGAYFTQPRQSGQGGARS